MCVAGTAVAEVICRKIDGYAIASAVLQPVTAGSASSLEGRADRPYAIKVPLANGVRFDWYDERPPPIPRLLITPEIVERARKDPADAYAPFFEWNLSFLEDQRCRGLRPVTMGHLEDVFYFESLDRSKYPAYRHLRHISPPNWFVTNNFGWRGPDIALNKPPNTIRIAFVGASTTIDAFGAPFSHPELVGFWLNRWAQERHLPYRFEVLNTGRTGIDTHSIAAIVTTELLPVEPDLVVYYEGANQFWPTQMIASEQSTRDFEKPRSTYRQRTVLENYSALVGRMVRAVELLSARGDGGEPPKPPSTINWPDGIDERDPPIDSQKLPMDLPAMLHDLEAMRAALAPIKAELIMSSFVWLVHDGMKLDLRRDLTLYDYLNRAYWPVTYSQMRRLADFQNRVFARYASAHRLEFIDLAAEYPHDPALAVDAVHFRYPGLVLEGWILLQHLVPLIEQRVADGRLPKAMQVVHTVHPAFDQPSPRLIRLDAVSPRCH